MEDQGQRRVSILREFLDGEAAGGLAAGALLAYLLSRHGARRLVPRPEARITTTEAEA